MLAGWAAVNAAFSAGVSTQTIVINICIGLALTLPGYIRGIVGGGDVKLMLAISPLWPSIYLLCVFAIGIGSLLLLMTVMYHAPKLPLLKAYYSAKIAITNPFERGIPLASAIALGALFMSIYTYLFN
jgi:prepilin peptidase CpaA